MAERLANRLREAREVKGWTQAQLAEAIGVSRKTVNTVENGVFVPSTLIALKLAAALGAPVEALFSVVQSGAVKIDVGQVYPLADAAKAHVALESRRTTGSTVLRI